MPNPQYTRVETRELFPTRIYTLDFQDLSSLDPYLEQARLLETLEGHRGTNGIWTSPDDLDLRPEWQDLRDQILASVELTVQDRGIDYLGIRMNCMWANINRGTGIHQVHTHPNAMWSVVLYLNVDKVDPGMFYFKDPRPQATTIVYDYLDGRAEYDHMSIEPKKGRLIVFPSWLEHGTHSTNSKEERVCISANIMLECRMRQNHTVRAEYR
jgi:uncharacterized protein (TIGR02466 family)